MHVCGRLNIGHVLQSVVAQSNSSNLPSWRLFGFASKGRCFFYVKKLLYLAPVRSETNALVTHALVVFGPLALDGNHAFIYSSFATSATQEHGLNLSISLRPGKYNNCHTHSNSE